jgi:uncharacterized protein (TIGR03066 family)
MMTASSVLFLALLSPAFQGDKPEELIIGKWQGKVKEGDKEFLLTIEFAKDGTFKSEVKLPDAKEPFLIKGKYKVIDGKTLETEATFMGETKKDKDTIKVTKDKLSVTDDKGKTVELTRVK